MKAARVALLIVALIALAGVFVWNYQQRNDPAFIISRIERGGDIPVIRLIELGERGRLDAYSDRLGELVATALEAEWKPAIAAHAAKNDASLTPADFSISSIRAQTGLPANNRTQRLADIFMLSNPAENASPEIIERVARASLHFELAKQTWVERDRDIPIGVVVYCGIDAWTETPPFPYGSELDEFHRMNRGISFGFNLGNIRLDGSGVPTRAELDFGVDEATKLDARTLYPPTNRHIRRDTFLAASSSAFALDWSEGVDATAEYTVLLYSADDQVLVEWTDSLSGTLSANQNEKVIAVAFDMLLDDALAGDNSALNRLLALGAQGELGPFADLLGARLATSLEAHWKPKVIQHAQEDLESRGMFQIEDLPIETSQLLTLFFCTEPLGHASSQTWEAVAKASTYARTDLFEEDDEAVIQHRTFTCLSGFKDDVRYQGLRSGMPTVEFGTPVLWAWTESGSKTRRGVSASGRGGPPGQFIPTEVSVTYIHSAEAASKLTILGAHSIPMRVTADFALLGANGIPFVTWTVTLDREVENPFVKQDAPLDEPAPDRDHDGHANLNLILLKRCSMSGL